MHVQVVVVLPRRWHHSAFTARQLVMAAAV